MAVFPFFFFFLILLILDPRVVVAASAFAVVVDASAADILRLPNTSTLALDRHTQFRFGYTSYHGCYSTFAAPGPGLAVADAFAIRGIVHAGAFELVAAATDLGLAVTIAGAAFVVAGVAVDALASGAALAFVALGLVVDAQ